MAIKIIKNSVELTGKGQPHRDNIKSINDNFTELDNKIIATGNISFNSVDSISFDTVNFVDAPNEGVLTWDGQEKTLSLGLNGGSIVLQIGQEEHIRVTNKTGLTIADGTPVMYNGTQGNTGRILIKPAIANSSTESHHILGIVTENIANNADGLVTTFGKVRHINTSEYVDGDMLYVSSTTPGGYTKTKPVYPNKIIPIAVVVSASNNGTLFVRPTFEDTAKIEFMENYLKNIGNYKLQTTKNGPSINRPVTPDIGLMFFDTQINKPIWWNGTNWVDSLGNIS